MKTILEEEGEKDSPARSGPEGAEVGNQPDLSEEERADVGERSAPRAAVVYEAIREEGEHELRRNVSSLAWSGLAAGLSMGFSFVAEGLLNAHISNMRWRPLVSKFGYSAGFLIVVLGRQQLFTENTLTVILPLLQRQSPAMLARVLRLWAVVLAANLLGALVFAWTVGHTEVFDTETRAAFAEIGWRAMEGSWGTILLRGIFAGWLIAMMVWLLPAAETARVWIIIIMTYLVALGGYSHIVVGSVEVLYVVTTGGAGWGAYFGGWMVPTLLGNIIGGVSLVALLGHAQVVSDETKGSER